MSNTEQNAINNNEVIFSAAVNKCIDNIIENEDFTEHTINKRTLSTHGGNYLGDLYEVDIQGRTDKSEKELNLFIKKIKILENRNIISESEVHAREIKVYEEILPVYAELETEANIPEEDRFKHVKCYAFNNEVVILDNLAKRGYKTLDRIDAMSAEYAKTAVEQLAKFHALSFVLKLKRPQYYMENVQGLENPMNFNENWNKFISGIIQLVGTYLDDKPKRILLAASSKITEAFGMYVQNAPMVLCHGDYRINNLLFKEEDGTITDLLPIDFQIIYNGHPLNDFMYLLFPSTDKEFRKKHLESVKDHYYETLSSYLKYFEIEVENVYPKKSFDADYEERLLYGLGASIMMFPILFRSDDVEKDSNLKSMSTLKISMHEAGRDRIRDLVDDFIEWGCL